MPTRRWYTAEAIILPRSDLTGEEMERTKDPRERVYFLKGDLVCGPRALPAQQQVEMACAAGAPNWLHWNRAALEDAVQRGFLNGKLVALRRRPGDVEEAQEALTASGIVLAQAAGPLPGLAPPPQPGDDKGPAAPLAPKPGPPALPPEAMYHWPGKVVLVLPETTTHDDDPRFRGKGLTTSDTAWVLPRGTHENHIVRAIDPLKPVTVKIWTLYYPGARPELPAGCGRGTTPADRAAGNTTLGFHEQCHREDMLEYLRTRPLPPFRGRVGMTVKRFREALDAYAEALRAYFRAMDEETFQKTDAVGPHAMPPGWEVTQPRRSEAAADGFVTPILTKETLRALAGLVGLLGVVLPAMAQRPPSEARARDLAPCAPGTPGYVTADAAFAELDAQIRALRDGEDVAPMNRRLAEFLRRPCFALSREDSRWESPQAPSALSLRTFWERGGALWVRSYLELHPTWRGPHPRRVVVPPDLRRSLSVEDHPPDVRPELLCSARDPTCGEETRTWRERAEMAFAEDARRGPLVQSAGREAMPAEMEAECSQTAQGASPERRYFVWRSCLGEIRQRVPVLPLGSFRAPERGWWVIRGRGVHAGEDPFYTWLNVYDLGTGAAYAAEHRTNLGYPPGPGGSLERAQPSRRVMVQVGQVPRDGVREALWVFLMAAQVDLAQVTAEPHALPAGLEPRWPRGEGSIGGERSGSLGATDQDVYQWEWIVEGQVHASGQFEWPVSKQVAEVHGGRLLWTLQDQLARGCPPQPLPQEFVPQALVPQTAPGSRKKSRAPDASRLAHRRVQWTETTRELLGDLRRAAAQECCPPQ